MSAPASTRKARRHFTDEQKKFILDSKEKNRECSQILDDCQKMWSDQRFDAEAIRNIISNCKKKFGKADKMPGPPALTLQKALRRNREAAKRASQLPVPGSYQLVGKHRTIPKIKSSPSHAPLAGFPPVSSSGQKQSQATATVPLESVTRAGDAPKNAIDLTLLDNSQVATSTISKQSFIRKASGLGHDSTKPGIALTTVPGKSPILKIPVRSLGLPKRNAIQPIEALPDAKRQKTSNSPALLDINSAVPMPPSFIDRAGSDMAKIFVGNGGRAFYIFRKPLLAKSAFFKETFEAQRPNHAYTDFSIFNLGQADENVFVVVADWFYTNKLDIFPIIPENGLENASSGLERNSPLGKIYAQAIARLIKVYDLAIELKIPQLMDATINRLGKAYDYVGWVPSSDDIKLVYAMPSAKTGLRRYMAEAFACAVWLCTDTDKKSKLGTLMTEMQELGGDFFELNMGALADGDDARKKSVGGNLVCDYHCHGSGEECEFKGMGFASEFSQGKAL